MSERRKQIEFGDFQTPLPLAEAVCARLQQLGVRPGTVVEPSCGEGSFLEAAARVFGAEPVYFGFDINAEYAGRAANRMKTRDPQVDARICEQDFFQKDWAAFLKCVNAPVLLLGNPPWVTNAALGVLEAENLPPKSNLKRLTGLNARTGKANFDISEWMLIQLMEAARCQSSVIAMLCKTGVARKALEYIWNNGLTPGESALFRIDAMRWFGVAVDACLLYARFTPDERGKTNTPVYARLADMEPLTRFGLADGGMVSNVDDYRALQHLCGVNYLRWRSGIKHDLVKVMELECVGGILRNGYGEVADVEADKVYPLYKATDVAKGRTETAKYVLVPQTTMGEDTSHLQESAPKTWDYLQRHEELFAARKSSIYRAQPKYSMFGLGAYSFAPYKIAVSGLHKNVRFTLVSPQEGKSALLDDTCYFISCETEAEAILLRDLFNADVTRQCLEAMLFTDSKRPVTADLLNRLDVKRIAETMGRETELAAMLEPGNTEANGQGLLLFTPKREYKPSIAFQPHTAGKQALK